MMEQNNIIIHNMPAEDVKIGNDTQIVNIGEGRVVYVEAETYEGSYDVTPSEAEQTLLTEGKTLEENVKVKPIPNNYGRIEWNGFYLAVI